MALSVAIGAATAALVVAQAALLASVITDAFLHGADLAAVRRRLGWLAAVMVGRAVLAWTHEVVAQRSSSSVKSELRSGLLDHSMKLGPQWLAGQRSGALATLATRGIDALDAYFSRYLPQLVLAVVVPVTILGVVVGQDLLSALIVACSLPLIPLFLALVGLAAERRTHRQWRKLEVLAGHFLDVVSGLPTLKVFGRARAQAESIRRVTEEHRGATMGVLRLSFLSSFALELLSTLSVALVAVSVGLRLVGGSLDLRTGLFILVLVPEAYLPLRAAGAQYHASVEGMAAAERVFEVMEQPIQPRGARLDVPDLASSLLRIEGVTVTYDGRSIPALLDFSMVVRPGEVVALAGPSGSGKSTLLSVLLGFVTPATGRVAVDGADGLAVDVADLELAAWRRQIAWVPQRPHLLAASVADNVRLGRPDASEQEVRRALADAGALDFVEQLSHGVETVLGEGGSGLSAGQRQRIPLARAFLRDAPLLLLDEPTAALDGDTETVVLEAVRRLARGRTVLLAAHRPALLEFADRTVTIEPAQLVADDAELAQAVPS